MSRARLVCSEILSKMSPVHQFDDKVYPGLNLSQDKVFNLCYNECSNVENSDVLSEMNPAMDDWLRQKSTSTSMCIDTAYLNDINLLSTRDPDMCSLDMGLELVLVNDKKESSLSSCSINDKNSDLDYTDPMLNLVPMNEVLLRKTETKCDNLLNGKDLYAETSLNKSRLVWDTLSIASRKSDCDTENNGDFSDFNLLSLSFDPNEQISAIEPVKNNSSVCIKNDKSDSTTNKVVVNDTMATVKTLTSPKSINKKLISVKRPNILRTPKQKTSELDNDVPTKNMDKNMNVDLFNTFNNTTNENDPILDFSHHGFVPTSDTEYTLLSDDIDGSMTFTVSTEAKTPNTETLSEQEKKIMRKHNISELNNMMGSIAIVTNTMVNSKSKTKIVIKTDKGFEQYEGNTTELTETVGTMRKNRRPSTPVEGEHIVMSVKTAATVKEEKKQNGCKVQQEPEDQLVREMLNVLGITDDMLYTILTNLGMRMWVCPEHECRRIFNRLNTLKCHILSHYGLKPFKCDFPNCPWSFYTSFKLKRHRETHLKKKDFVCTVPDCNRTFTTIYNLNSHLKLHERPARLKCLVRTCNFRFQTRRAMEMHLKTHESSQAPYKCLHPGCTKLYFSCNALTAHSRRHQHKEEELRCQWENCGRLFDKPCRLKAHMRQHTGDKPYVCRYKDCKWAFSSSSKLKRHQYKHNNERKFRCTIGDCTKAFMRSEHLREHTFTHIAQRTFQCSICGEKCSAKATLYVHKKKFHPNETSKANNGKDQIQFKNDSIISELTNEKCDIPENNLITENVENDNTTYLISLLPNGKPPEIQTVKKRPVVVQDIDGQEYEVNLDSLNPLDNIVTLPSTSKNTSSQIINKTKSRKLKSKATSVIKSCARTYLPYERVKKSNGLLLNDKEEAGVPTSAEIILDSSLSKAEVNNITVTSDILLGSDLLGNNQETIYLSNLMLQDEIVTDDIYTQEDGAEYILLFDSDANTNFSESTVNLKDLD